MENKSLETVKEYYGKTVLDLGCGTGRDNFLLSNLVGPEGRLIGIEGRC